MPKKKQDTKTVKITHPAPVEGNVYQAGEIVTVSAWLADQWIADDWAFEYSKDKISLAIELPEEGDEVTV